RVVAAGPAGQALGFRCRGGEGHAPRRHRARCGARGGRAGGPGEADVRGGRSRGRRAPGGSTRMTHPCRVVVTGVGMVTPVGTGRDRFWSAVRSGTSGVREITRFDTSRYKVHRGCEVPDFDFEEIVGAPRPPGLRRASQLAIPGTHLALADPARD